MLDAFHNVSSSQIFREMHGRRDLVEPTLGGAGDQSEC